MPRWIITRLSDLTEALASLVDAVITPVPEPKLIPIRVRRERCR